MHRPPSPRVRCTIRHAPAHNRNAHGMQINLIRLGCTRVHRQNAEPCVCKYTAIHSYVSGSDRTDALCSLRSDLFAVCLMWFVALPIYATIQFTVLFTMVRRKGKQCAMDGLQLQRKFKRCSYDNTTVSINDNNNNTRVLQ